MLIYPAACHCCFLHFIDRIVCLFVAVNTFRLLLSAWCEVWLIADHTIYAWLVRKCAAGACCVLASRLFEPFLKLIQLQFSMIYCSVSNSCCLLLNVGTKTAASYQVTKGSFEFYKVITGLVLFLHWCTLSIYFLFKCVCHTAVITFSLVCFHMSLDK